MYNAQLIFQCARPHGQHGAIMGILQTSDGGREVVKGLQWLWAGGVHKERVSERVFIGLFQCGAAAHVSVIGPHQFRGRVGRHNALLRPAGHSDSGRSVTTPLFAASQANNGTHPTANSRLVGEKAMAEQRELPESFTRWIQRWFRTSHKYTSPSPVTAYGSRHQAKNTTPSSQRLT